VLHCYHVVKAKEPTKSNPRNIQIPEVEGEREVEGPKLDSEDYATPLKNKKVNIGTVDC